MVEFKNKERLFRKIPNNPNMRREDGSISSVVFKDSNGCSVDRQLDRKLEDVYKNFISKFSDIIAIADVKYQDCINVGAIVKEVPLENNKYHCEIHRSEEKAQLTPGQARKLSRMAQVYDIKNSYT